MRCGVLLWNFVSGRLCPVPACAWRQVVCVTRVGLCVPVRSRRWGRLKSRSSAASRSVWVRSLGCLRWVLCSRAHLVTAPVSRGGCSGERSASVLSPLAGRIHFLGKSPFPCCHLETALGPWRPLEPSRKPAVSLMLLSAKTESHEASCPTGVPAHDHCRTRSRVTVTSRAWKQARVPPSPLR